MHAFLSYSRRNEHEALRLAKRLRALGASIWVDQLDIALGAPWDQSVEDALRTSRTVVVLLSAESLASANVLDEITFALDAQKTLIPVMLERCTKPLRLARLQHIDLTRDWDDATAALAAQLLSAQRQAAAPGAEPRGGWPAIPKTTGNEPARSGKTGRRIAVTMLILVAGAGATVVSRLMRGPAQPAHPEPRPPSPRPAAPEAAASSPCTARFEDRPISCLESGR